LIPHRTTFEFEYLREFEPEFENVLGYELGAHIGSIHEKNQGPKISCYCTFKAVVEAGDDFFLIAWFSMYQCTTSVSLGKIY
jgi:hypothetical protein